MFKTITIPASNPCPNCGRELQPVQNADNATPDENVQFDCIVCGYRYSYVSVSVSVPVAQPAKYETKSPYCEICDKHFSQSSALKRHMIVHSFERPFCCNDCDKSFKTKAALKRHSIIHTGECPFECSTCKRKFNQISNLRKHLVIHNNNCPFYCNICGKGFNQLSNMKKHSIVHRDYKETSDSDEKSDHVVPPPAKKTANRPVLTFVKPATS